MKWNLVFLVQAKIHLTIWRPCFLLQYLWYKPENLRYDCKYIINNEAPMMWTNLKHGMKRIWEKLEIFASTTSTEWIAKPKKYSRSKNGYTIPKWQPWNCWTRWKCWAWNKKICSVVYTESDFFVFLFDWNCFQIFLPSVWTCRCTVFYYTDKVFLRKRLI